MIENNLKLNMTLSSKNLNVTFQIIGGRERKGLFTICYYGGKKPEMHKVLNFFFEKKVLM